MSISLPLRLILASIIPVFQDHKAAVRLTSEDNMSQVTMMHTQTVNIIHTIDVVTNLKHK